MSDKSGLVVFLALALVLANAWKSGTVQDLASGKVQTGTSGEKWYQTPWGTIGYEMIGVIVAAALASTGDEMATVMLVVLIGLWLLFLIGKFSPGSLGKKGSATS